MLWLVFVLLAAIFAPLQDLVSKRALEKIGDEYIITWSSRFFALPFFIPLLFDQISKEVPTWNAFFIGAIAIVLFLQIISNIFYFRAIKSSDLSITVPLISFTPLFVLVTSPFLLKEFPGWWDILGIGFVVGGSYILKLKNQEESYLAPLRSLFLENAPRLMLAVAFIWSLISTLNKLGIEKSSPIFWAALTSTVLATAMTPVMLYQSRDNLKFIPENIFYLFIIGILQGLTMLCFMKAVKLTLVAQAVSVKRTSILFSALLGHLFLQEPGMQQRMTGAVVMLVGVVIITLF
ncbi:DMT family transporter [Geitlerinema sp. PCC 9228]|uniref:DMT family transporter n=1 Tax=Geitlerinema sp. PCC 9228 TaxID=111611 RepID=UPI0008F9E3AF|nr:DMT family transporter [Geitlerinema sp. PCC 9228]